MNSNYQELCLINNQSRDIQFGYKVETSLSNPTFILSFECIWKTHFSGMIKYRKIDIFHVDSETRQIRLFTETNTDDSYSMVHNLMLRDDDKVTIHIPIKTNIKLIEGMIILVEISKEDSFNGCNYTLHTLNESSESAKSD
jgi:hypothetical protein